MKFALINPNWKFPNSIYFGCSHYHLPLEYGYAANILKSQEHEAVILDAHLTGISDEQIRTELVQIEPDITVITTAPTYLFWRCPPPELSVPMALAEVIRDVCGRLIVVGPHGSTTPKYVLNKLGADAVVIGECEDMLANFATQTNQWQNMPSVCTKMNDEIVLNWPPHEVDVGKHDAICWPNEFIMSHTHQHHRFDSEPIGPGAEIEASRGCPFHCSFCAKHSCRDRYRKRNLNAVLKEIDMLISQGVEYIYFIDEIFLPDGELLGALETRTISFGIQTRIDMWSAAQLDQLGHAGCMSIEAGVESISDRGRRHLNKNCRLTTDQLTELLIRARQTVPFVQATLMDIGIDDPEQVQNWRQMLSDEGIWTNKPVPLYPYPGSLEYVRHWGVPDDEAWIRSHEYYLSLTSEFSDIQDSRPLPLSVLEAGTR